MAVDIRELEKATIDEPRLHELADVQEDADADLVFVHGLGGNPISTWWRNSVETFWPQWMWEDLNRQQRVNTFTLAYPSKPSHWFGNGAMALSRRAGGVLELFSIQPNPRPLLFVCHSLGGLLVKQMLRLSADRIDDRSLLERTAAVVFVATPHLGAAAAAAVGKIERILRLTDTARDLQANNPFLDELARWYSDHATEERIATYAIREHDKIRLKKWFLYAPLVMVVDYASANPNVKGATVITADGDHLAVCKPKTKESLIHQVVRSFLESTLRELKQRPSYQLSRLSELLGGIGDDDADCYFVMSCFRDSHLKYPKPKYDLEFEGDTVSPEDSTAAMWLASLVTKVRTFERLTLITTSDFKDKENENLLSIGGSVTNDASRFALEDGQLGAPFSFHQRASEYRIECCRCRLQWNAQAIGQEPYVPGGRTRPDYGIIVKLDHGTRSIIVVAGLGPVGTKGAAYYLLKHWDQLWDWYCDQPFGVVLEFSRGGRQDEDPSFTLATVVHHTDPRDVATCADGQPRTDA